MKKSIVEKMLKLETEFIENAHEPKSHETDLSGSEENESQLQIFATKRSEAFTKFSQNLSRVLFSQFVVNVKMAATFQQLCISYNWRHQL